MDSEVGTLEGRLNSFLAQLHAESAILERMVYKNKNQHRRTFYFQYLLKVRRDLRLLRSAKLEELLGFCFQVITGEKPRQKLNLLESLKRRKCESRKPNFMEQLHGAARLLSQMVEPMLKAACEISILLARSFFMGFSLTILALLARFRVLVQQILLDVVSVFNMVSCISQKKQSVKLTHEGLEVFREYFPTHQDYIMLDCVWQSDKFVLVASAHKSGDRNPASGQGENPSIDTPAVHYRSIKCFLEDESVPAPETTVMGKSIGQASLWIEQDGTGVSLNTSGDGTHEMQGNVSMEVGDNTANVLTPEKKLSTGDDGLLDGSSLGSESDPSTTKSGPKRVAFVSVKRPLLSTSSDTRTPTTTQKKIAKLEDPFFNLLARGNLQDSLLDDD